MIVLSEASFGRPASPSAQDNIDMTEAARLAGCSVYYIPKDFSICETAENALWHMPEQPSEVIAIWVGFIPSFDRYSAIYEEALRKKIRLINSPDQHRTAQEFDLAYPLLQGLTPESLVLTSPAESMNAGEIIGFPLFVRGAVRSRKAAGWKACVAATPEELNLLVHQLFDLEYRSRGRVIVRKLVRLRYNRYSEEGFPLGREYRVFVFRGEVVGLGYYWEGRDPLEKLSPEEERQVLNLAAEAAERLGVPFVAIDIGQLESGEWIVVEANDGQFAGTGSIPLLPLWNALMRIQQNRAI
jgi:ATP-grasp domain, R2K clade family 3